MDTEGEFLNSQHQAFEILKNCSYPLSGEVEERVDQRSVVGVSRLARQALAVMSAGVDSRCSPTLLGTRHPSLPQAERGQECFGHPRLSTDKFNAYSPCNAGG
jgi:hypothetical protein